MGIRQLNRLSARFVEAAPDGFHPDGGNLYLKVADGRRRRSWVFRFVRGGKVTSMGLGAASAVSLKEARAKRVELAKLLEEGINPLTERRKNRLADAQRKTFADAAAAYIEQRRRDWSTSSLNQWKHTVSRYCASIAKLCMNEIGLDDVKRVVMPLVDKGLVASARQTQSRIQIVLNFAVEHGWRAEDRRSAWSPVAKRPKGERPHHPMLPWKDAPAFVAALRASDGLSARVLEYVILTAARLSEGREARRSEIDLAAKTWTVPGSRTKTRQPHVVPLSDRALEIIAECDSHPVSPAVLRPPRQTSCLAYGGLGPMRANERREGVPAWVSGYVPQLVRGHWGRVRGRRERARTRRRWGRRGLSAIATSGAPQTGHGQLGGVLEWRIRER
jgi:integrase